MFEFFAVVGDYLAAFWRVVTQAMRLNPETFANVERLPIAGLLTLGIAIVGGISQLLGQSVILFVNRVRPSRFALSLLLNGLTYLAGLLVWGLSIWLAARLFFGLREPLTTVLRMVSLGAAPYVFGFLVLMPYAGVFIGRVLGVWSLLIVLSAVRFTYGLTFWQSLFAVVGGWLLMQLLGSTIGRPIVALRSRLFRRVAGTDLSAPADDLLATFIGKQDDR